MHEQCMQLNVWLLIEIQIENTLGLMNEKSNSLKSHGVGDVRHPLKTDVATGLFQRLTTFAVIIRFASLRYLSDWSQIAERSEPYSRIWVEDANSRIRFASLELGIELRFAAHCGCSVNGANSRMRINAHSWL